MGRPKATLVLGGQTLASRTSALLGSVASPVVEVGPGTAGPSVSRVVSERPPGRGPLSAIAAGWEALVEAGHEGPVLVLGVDLPLVTQALLALLASWPGADSVVPIADRKPQWLCARYSAADLARANTVLASGERSVAAWIQASPWVPVGPESWSPVAGPAGAEALRDIDTPADVDWAETLLG